MIWIGIYIKSDAWSKFIENDEIPVSKDENIFY